MESNFRKKFLLGSLSITGSFILFGGLLYWMSGVLDEKTKEILARRATVERQAQLIASLASLKTAAPEVAKYKQALNALLPSKDDLVNFPSWIDGLARTHRISQTFAFQSGAAAAGNESGADFIGFSLNARGDYADLVNFLESIEFKEPRYLVTFGGFDLKRDASMLFRIATDGKVFFSPSKSQP